MMHVHDRASMAHALTLNLDPELHRLLTDRIAALVTLYGDLTDWTEFVIVEAQDTEADIVRHIGFSPLVEPFDGIRFDESDFHPQWDRLTRHGGWFVMTVSFGSTFAYVLLIRDIGDEPDDLRRLCKQFTRP